MSFEILAVTAIVVAIVVISAIAFIDAFRNIRKAHKARRAFNDWDVVFVFGGPTAIVVAIVMLILFLTGTPV